MLCASALILAPVPNFALVFLTEILHRPRPASLPSDCRCFGLVGRRAMSIRTGRNYRFNAAGHDGDVPQAIAGLDNCALSSHDENNG
jgi:hypothetical protein